MAEALPALTGHTALVALIGDPIAHVRAPAIFNPRFVEAGLDACLIPIHVPAPAAPEIIPQLARIPNLKGLVVTIPHKETMARLCHELGPNGRLMGAVNTVRFPGQGRMIGEMFDGLGLIDGARAAGFEPRGQRVLLLGAGGAGRAIAFAMAAEGVRELAIFNRNPERATRLVEEVGAAFPDVPVRVAAADGRGFDLVVNCTSAGLHEGDPMPLDPATLDPRSGFIDIIAPRDTELLLAAQRRGCRTMGGRPMIEHQIAAQLRFIGIAG